MNGSLATEPVARKGPIAGVVRVARRFYSVSLFRNTAYLLLHGVVSNLLGFVFWIVAARLYSPENLGRASAAIAAGSLLATAANFGFGTALIRFLSSSGRDGNRLLNSSFTIGVVTSVALTLVFMSGLSLWSPGMAFIRQNPISLVVFTMFVTGFTLLALLGAAFIAERRAGFNVAMGLVLGVSRVPTGILLARPLASMGVFISWTISTVVAVVIGLFLFLPLARRGYRPRVSLDRRIVGDLLHFSVANHIANFLQMAPGFLLSMIIVTRLGPESNAYFYMPWTIGVTLLVLSSAAAEALFAEGSHEEKGMPTELRRAMRMTFFILVPIVGVVLAIPERLLLFFGHSYAERGATLLRLLTAATLPIAVNQMFLSTRKVQRKIATIIAMAVFTSISTVTLSYLLLPRFNINAVGIAQLSSQGAVALVVLATWIRGRPLLARLRRPIRK